MKKLRFVATIFIAFAMVFGMASCSKKAESTSSTAATTTAATTAASPAATESKAAETAPAAKELTIDEKLIADQWCFKYTAEGYGEFSFFFKFYDEDPVLGKVYYAGMSNNRINFAGTYKLVEKDYEYTVYRNREDQQAKTNEVTGVAKYSVVLYDWDGNITGRIGFDGEHLINGQDKNTAVIYATGSTPYFYEKNTGSFDATIAGEMPVAVYEYVADNDVTSTIQINHNHTYTDLVAAMIEGTWTASQNDGGITFDLAPNDKTDTPATLAVSADKQTAVYTAKGEDPINMSVPKPTVTVEHTFEGTTPTSYGKDATLVIECLSDGTFTLNGTVYGRTMEFDKGTWSVDHSYKFTFDCEKAGSLTTSIIDRVIHLTYKQGGTALGDLESDMVRK